LKGSVPSSVSGAFSVFVFVGPHRFKPLSTLSFLTKRPYCLLRTACFVLFFRRDPNLFFLLSALRGFYPTFSFPIVVQTFMTRPQGPVPSLWQVPSTTDQGLRVRESPLSCMVTASLAVAIFFIQLPPLEVFTLLVFWTFVFFYSFR